MGAGRELLSQRSPGVPASTQPGACFLGIYLRLQRPPSRATSGLHPSLPRLESANIPPTHPHPLQSLGNRRSEAERSAFDLQKEKSNHLFVQTKVNHSLSRLPCPKPLISPLAASPEAPSLSVFRFFPPSSTPPATLGISVSRPAVLLPPPHPQEAWLEDEIRRLRDRTS